MQFILGLIVGIILMSALYINKTNNYEKQINTLMVDNMELKLQLYNLKYGKNKHITM